jgi:hypothetical protein
MKFDDERRSVALPLILRNRNKVTVRIMNIVESRVENRIGNARITEIGLLFGITFRGNKVYLCSDAEDQGKTLFEMKLRLSKPEVEIFDDTAMTQVCDSAS